MAASSGVCSRCGMRPVDATMAELTGVLTRQVPGLCSECLALAANTKPVAKPANGMPYRTLGRDVPRVIAMPDDETTRPGKVREPGEEG